MRRRRRSLLPYLFLIFAGLVACVLLLAGYWVLRVLPQKMEQDFGRPTQTLSPTQRMLTASRLYLRRGELLSPVDAGAHEVDFTIHIGETVPEIAGRLEQENIIRSADSFQLYLVYAGLDTGVQAGDYQLSPALNAVQIAHALQDATPTEVSFSILPGWRAEEIADALPTSGLNITREEFLNLVAHPAELTLPDGWPELTTLEGFLYPDVYRVRRDIDAKGLIETFLIRFDEEVSPDLRQALERQGYDLVQTVILASMVQREAVLVEEQPMIASVFLNRLNVGMKLDSDPTVQYALGYNEKQKTWWTNPLSLDDLSTQSPYNTYSNPDLPPGPISNPALSALQAVAYPAKTPYFYFRARCDQSGKHAFARTFEEHMQNACP